MKSSTQTTRIMKNIAKTRLLTFASDTSSTLMKPGTRTLHRQEATSTKWVTGIKFWVSLFLLSNYLKFELNIEIQNAKKCFSYKSSFYVPSKFVQSCTS